MSGPLPGGRAELRRRQRALQSQLSDIEKELAALEIRQTAQARRRAIKAAISQACIFRDGTPRNSPAHREIAMRYAWHAFSNSRSLPSPSPEQTGRSGLLVRIRLRELERLFSYRYGAVLPDDAVGRGAAALAAHHIAHIRGEVFEHITAWARVWAPWMDHGEAAALATRIMAKPLKFRADTLGARLHLTQLERHELAITTIGPCDVSRQQRERFRKLKRAIADRERRRKKGAVPRPQYEANSLAKLQPWRDLGISRATYYRRLRSAPAV